VLFTQPNNINVIQRGKAKVKVRVVCLEAVKMYGNNPKKLFITINKNKEIKTKEDPLKEEGPKRVLNSLCNLFRTEDKKIADFLEESQKVGTTKLKINKELIQLIGILKLAEGSNTPKRLVIIFRLFLLVFLLF